MVKLPTEQILLYFPPPDLPRFTEQTSNLSPVRLSLPPSVRGDQLLCELAGGLGQAPLNENLLADVTQGIGYCTGCHLTPDKQSLFNDYDYCPGATCYLTKNPYLKAIVCVSN